MIYNRRPIDGRWTRSPVHRCLDRLAGMGVGEGFRLSFKKNFERGNAAGDWLRALSGACASNRFCRRARALDAGLSNVTGKPCDA